MEYGFKFKLMKRETVEASDNVSAHVKASDLQKEILDAVGPDYVVIQIEIHALQEEEEEATDY